jgi:hypothetical protein
MTKEDAQVRFFLESNPQVMEAEEVIKNFINEISLFPFYLFLFSLIVFAVILTPLNPNQVCLYLFNLYKDQKKNAFLTENIGILNWYGLFVPRVGNSSNLKLVGSTISALMFPTLPGFFAGFIVMMPRIFQLNNIIFFCLSVSGISFQKFLGLFAKNKEVGARIEEYSSLNDESARYRHWLRRQLYHEESSRELKSNARSILFSVIMCILLMPFLVIYIPFHTAFTPDSQNIVSGVITAIYILIFLVILAWLLSVNDWIRHKLASKIHLNEYIIFSISECIKEIANEEAWNYPAHRRNLQQMLHNIGDLIEFDLCRKTILTRIPESVSHKKTFRLISYRFRELSYWLVSPKKDTRIALNNNLINILESYLDGDLDALVNSSIPDPPFSRIAPLNRIKLILMLLIRIFSPVVLVWLFIHTPFSPEAPIDD